MARTNTQTLGDGQDFSTFCREQGYEQNAPVGRDLNGIRHALKGQ